MLTLIAVTVIGWTLYRQATTTVQAQQSTDTLEAASLFDVKAAEGRQTSKSEVTEQPDVKSPAGELLTVGDSQQLAPEGSVCGWTASTNFPITILDQATATVGSNLYTFGGVSTAIIANAYKFDGTTWTPIAPLPAALEFPTAVSDGTNIYILGGALVGTGTPQTTLYRYNVALDTYTPLAPFTTGTWNTAAVYLGGKIYKFAGTAASASTNVLEIYDVAANTWSAGANYPLSISFVSAFVRGGFVYGAGGIQSVGSVASDKTYRYDPATNMWDDAAIADLPATRWGAASSITPYGVNNGWVLAGGYVAGTATANISPTVIRWNPTTNVWDSLTSMAGERSRMTGAVLAGSFYVIGGRSLASSGFVGTNSNQKLLCFSGVAVINSGTATIVSESYPPANGAPDPGETVTVRLPLQNVGDTATTNLTATLQATGGVTNPSPAAQNYGVLAPGGPAVTRDFTFTVNPSQICGSTITLTWVVNDGATNYPNVVKTFVVGTPIVVTQNFDGVTPPALPAGWTTTQDTGTDISWTTTATGPSSAPNSAFANDPATLSMASLVSPPFAISSTTSRLSFKNKYITESTFDGMVLEIKIGAGAFQDILTAGGTFVSGGYNSTISTGFMSPIGGRMAWSGTSAGGYIDTVVNLPASANGQNVQFRWSMASDISVSATGVNIDDVQVLNGFACATGGSVRSRADFDGDGKTDLSVFRPSEGNWYIDRSTAGFLALHWGSAGDVLVPGDYDGDGKTDTAIFRANADPAQPDFYILNSNGFTLSGVSWGLAGDIPVVADYDNDGKSDAAVYRPSSNTWYVLKSGGGIIATVFGQAGDVAVAGNFGGDASADLTVYRSSTNSWITQITGGGVVNFVHGTAGDILVPADYDGDNIDDRAVYRPSTGQWFVLRSTNGTVAITSWGNSTDVPVPGDYDGDGSDDLAVYRAGQWWINKSTGGTTTVSFGTATDQPVPKSYLP
jgi:N-acetylneuraminic acid mutarotase